MGRRSSTGTMLLRLPLLLPLLLLVCVETRILDATPPAAPTSGPEKESPLVAVASDKAVAEESEQMPSEHAQSRQSRLAGSESPQPGENINLKWVAFQGTVPPEAVSTWISDIAKTVYVCRVSRGSGFHVKGETVCRWPFNERERQETSFELLVNENNLEQLEWLAGSYGRVPSNAIPTYPGLYVGRNKYGLGKVDVRNEALFVVRKGKESWYKTYEVLSVSTMSFSQSVSNVVYDTAGATVQNAPLRAIKTMETENLSCREVTKTSTLTTTLTHHIDWQFSRSMTFGVDVTVTAGIPEVFSTSVTVSSQATHTVTQGMSVSESVEFSGSVSVPVPPLNRCAVSIMAVQSDLTVPYSATVKRVFRNGLAHSGPIAGVYRGTVWSNMKVLVGRCTPIADAKPC